MLFLYICATILTVFVGFRDAVQTAVVSLEDLLQRLDDDDGAKAEAIKLIDHWQPVYHSLMAARSKRRGRRDKRGGRRNK